MHIYENGLQFPTNLVKRYMWKCFTDNLACLNYNQIWPCRESWALKRVLLLLCIFHVSIKRFLPYTGESKFTFLWESKRGWVIYSFVQSSNTSKRPIICVLYGQLNHNSPRQAHFCSWIMNMRRSWPSFGRNGHAL